MTTTNILIERIKEKFISSLVINKKKGKWILNSIHNIVNEKKKWWKRSDKCNGSLDNNSFQHKLIIHSHSWALAKETAIKKITDLGSIYG